MMKTISLYIRSFNARQRRKWKPLGSSFLAVIIFLLLLIYFKLPRRARVTSSVVCKGKLSQTVFPNELERLKYLSGIHREPYVLEQDYFGMVTVLKQQCFRQMHLGPPGEGGWEICLDRQFDLSENCLVYSFGVGNDMRFEYAIEETFGCEVHAFDPSMNQASHQYSDKGYFHNIGLDSTNHMTAAGGWIMRTLPRIMSDLKHDGKTIDYLKLDIEFAEWPALHDMIETGVIKQVRQLVMETHTPEMDIHTAPEHKCTYSNIDTMAFMLKTLMRLHQVGFEVYYSRPNYLTEYTSKLTALKRLCCYNVHLVNLKHPANKWKPH